MSAFASSRLALACDSARIRVERASPWASATFCSASALLWATFACAVCASCVASCLRSIASLNFFEKSMLRMFTSEIRIALQPRSRVSSHFGPSCWLRSLTSDLRISSRFGAISTDVYRTVCSLASLRTRLGTSVSNQFGPTLV